MAVQTLVPQPASAVPPDYDPRRYQPTLSKLPETAKSIFKDYSQIPEQEILDHIYRVRAKAWDILPYPCIGVFRFLDFSAKLSPIYPDVIRRVQNGEIFLDLGCCFGQDIRKLVSDGAPSENIIGADSEGRFIELGYELFQDRDKLKSKFYTASIFDDDFLAEWHGKVDIIYAGAFFHLFDFDKQVKVMSQLVKLLNKKPGSIVFGRNLAADNAGNFRMSSFDWDLYRHNIESMEKLWNRAPDGSWSVSAELIPYKSEGWDKDHRGWEGDETKEMRFVVSRQ